MSTRFPYACRLNSFKSRPDLYEWTYGQGDVRDLVLDGQVEALDSLVLNYPEHFELGQEEVHRALRSSDLRLRAVNTRFPESIYSEGTLINPDSEKREKALALLMEGVDICRDFGADHLVIWLSTDGFDYPFQVDYRSAWEQVHDGICKIADYAHGLRVSLEYKPTEPRKRNLLGDMASTLLLLDECHRSNLGVTIDYCHSLMAGEDPGFAAFLAAKSGRLFGVHLNDGYGHQDDGLMVGSASYVQTAELLFYIMEFGYRDVLYFDTFPQREDPVQECAANIRIVEEICQKLEGLDRALFASARSAQDALRIRRILNRTFFGEAT